MARAGACFSKVPRTFRARKAIRKISTCLFCEADLFICCKGNKNKNNCKVSCLETPSPEVRPKSFGPRARFSKVPKLRANRLFWKADLLACFQGNGKKKNCEV